MNDTLALNGIGTNPPLLSGSDEQDGIYNGNSGSVRNPLGIVITSLPDNGELFYNGNPVVAGDTIADPSLLKIVVSGDDYTEVNFEYTYIDAAGYADPTPATYNVNWTATLPVTFLYFSAFNSNNEDAVLEWVTVSEENNKGFGIERSLNGKDWHNIGFVTSLAPGGNSHDKLFYTFNDSDPVNGINCYRLKQTDYDNNYSYSTVQTVVFSGSTKINVYPNPTYDKLTIDGLQGNEIISLTNVSDQHLRFTNVYSNSMTIDIKSIAPGIYMLTIIDTSGITITNKKIQKVN